MLTYILDNLSQVSHFLSMAAILSCATAMLVLILRLIGEDLVEGGGASIMRMPKLPPPRMDVVKIFLPFTVTLPDPLSCSLKRLTLRYCSQQGPRRVHRIKARLFLGVSTLVYHQILRAPWSWFKDSFMKSYPFGGVESCLEASPVKIVDFQGKDDAVVTMTRESNEELDLGSNVPRHRYPIVLCSMPDNNEDDHWDEEPSPTRIGAVLQVIHLKDNVCTIPTQILYTHLKHTDGRSTCLSNIYTSSSEVNDSEDDDDENEDEERREKKVKKSRCVICHDLYVTRVFFPCRHACVCGPCSNRLSDRCPMCRTRIESYFLLHEENSNFQSDSSEDNSDGNDNDLVGNRSWLDALNDFNRRFAQAIGLQENLD